MLKIIQKWKYKYKEKMNELPNRQQHIAELQSELLRMDYEYGIVISSLKQKQKIVEQLIQQERERNKRFEYKNKKLQGQIKIRDKSIAELQKQVQNLRNLSKQKDYMMRQLEESNKSLTSQIKVLQSNLQKYQVKLYELHKKKQKYREQIKKLNGQNQSNKKKYQKLSMKNKQLQALVQAEVQETQNRIELISNQIINNGNFPLLPKSQKGQNNSMHTILSCSSINESISSDWESDMRKLKNCIEYGTQYILVFDPSNLDRMPTRQIFKYIKQCLNEKTELTKQVQNYKSCHQKLINEHKKMIQSTEKQLEKIMDNQKRQIKVDTQIQTQNFSGPQAQKAVFHLSELNLALKLKNSDLISYLQLFAIRNIVYSNWLKNSHLNCQYLRKMIKSGQKSMNQKTALHKKTKLKTVSISVWFIQILLSRKVKHRKQSANQYKRNRRVNQLICQMIKQVPINPQINRLKEISLKLEEKQKIELVEQTIQYYQYKLDQRLSSNSIAKQFVYFYKY